MGSRTAPPTGRGSIVLAGGRSTRMGRDKAGLHLAGRGLLSHVVDAASVFGPVVVVAPAPLAATSLDAAAAASVHAVVLEDPPYGGPVAGIAAGVGALPAGAAEALVLACDLPRAAQVVAALVAADLGGADVLRPVDEEGFAQLLAARYRVPSLRAALAALDDVRDVSVRRMARPLRQADVAVPTGALEDVDDPQAAARHGIVLP